MSIAENLLQIRSELPESVTLVAISKTRPVSDILEAYAAGQTDFGENKVQELVDKEEQIRETLRWHQVGTLQRNKVKYIAPFVHLIHSVESRKLLLEIEKQGAKNSRTIDVLLQMHIAEEESKFGLDEKELKELMDDPEIRELRHIRIRGLMGMATFTEDTVQVAREFRGLRKLYDQVSTSYSGMDNCLIDTLSMGMSGDYRIAVEEGSTLVRVGTAIFGARNYGSN